MNLANVIEWAYLGICSAREVRDIPSDAEEKRILAELSAFSVAMLGKDLSKGE